MKTDFLVDLDDRSGVSMRLLRAASWAVRIAIGIGFLSAVADRFGLWGPSGAPGVTWGNLAKYNAYVAQLNWFVPAVFIPFVGWVATIAELVLGLALLAGWHLRRSALFSALLLLSFGLSMTLALGPHAPLSYSVFAAASAAFLLFAIQPTGGASLAPIGEQTGVSLKCPPANA
jgi:uncharacterized membrane protein YphA (DoxX/SURF4 family)